MTFAPQPDGYPCADPDYTKPLPGEVIDWPGLPLYAPLRPPVGLWADSPPQPCSNPSRLPAVRILETPYDQPPTVF